jgi:hypothetical protein
MREREREREREKACKRERERDRDSACFSLVSAMACFSLVSCLLDAYCDAPGAGGVTLCRGEGGGKGGCRLSAAAPPV